MEKICDSRLCTGCAACFQICPQGAITMSGNEEGFLYPEINTELCNDCKMCSKTCPVNGVSNNCVNGALNSCADGALNNYVNGAASSCTEKMSGIFHKVYACFSKDVETRLKSTSGGAFTQLSLAVLSSKGIVFGAGFDTDFKVCHTYVESERELDNLRRSKYVQSDIGNCFKEARSFLREGRKVLFSGTPCQIAGLKAFLKRDYDNLLTCDIACHGVPSPLVWDMYLDYIKDRYGSGVSAVSFRDKSTGWNSSSMTIGFKDGSKYTDSVKKEIFFMGFGKSIFNRKSCYDCKFRIDNTKADLTLADFWGIDRTGASEYSDNKGVSLVITHTNAGEKALAEIKNKLHIEERGLEEAVKYNPRLVTSVGEPAGRKSFFEDMAAGRSFDRLRRKYMDNASIKYRLKCLVKSFIQRDFIIQDKSRQRNLPG